MNLRNLACVVLVFGLLSGCAILPSKNYTGGVSSRCEVHGVEMERTIVPIVYGLMLFPLDKDYDRALTEATKSVFPHAEEFVGGGCIVRLGAPKRAAIYVCLCCRSAKAEWMEQHHPKSTTNKPEAGNLPMASQLRVGSPWHRGNDLSHLST